MQATLLPDVERLLVETDAGPTYVPTPHGAVVLSQTCDLAQLNRHTVQVSPLAILTGLEAADAARENRPRYAPVYARGAAEGDQPAGFADLEVVATWTKGRLAQERQEPAAWHTTEHARRFGRAVGRRFSRFAWPDNLQAWLSPLEKLSRDVQRRMQHRQWDVSDTDGSYALGLMGQRVGERRLLGHSGGYPGHITRTLFDQAARLAVSVFTNAIDGPAAELTTGAVRILDLAAGAESDSDAATRSRFCGRFAGLWGVLDVADLGGRLFALDPTEAEPAAPGYDAPDETMVFTFDGDAVESVRGDGGTTRWPLEAYAATIAGRDRVTAPDVR